MLDICPFTTIGTFNRSISVDNRKRIASELALFLGVAEPVPESFDGIPTLNNQNSVVFWDRSDIDPLWRVFEDGIVLADADNEDNRQSFSWTLTVEYFRLEALGGNYRLAFSGPGLTDSRHWITAQKVTCRGT